MSDLVKQACLRDGLEVVYSSLRDIPRTVAENQIEPWYELDEDEKTEPWRFPICDRWTLRAKPLAGFLLKSLGESGPDHVVSDTINEDPQRIGNNIPAHHAYLINSTDSPNPLVIDGTWQQFADPELLENAPRILIAPATRTFKVLQSAGVDPGL
jgi:hypothetical protein